MPAAKSSPDYPQGLKLHLGCGNYYLEGYVNIDFPPAHHTVQASLRADLYQDLRTLVYPNESIQEIRLHHVFEHFPRPVALALLCRWRDWLAIGARLHIETPDLMASAWSLVSPFRSFGKKQQVIRHLFGSHEASWGVHWDGWYARRFVVTLSSLGFVSIRTRKTRWGELRNIEIFADKGPEAFTLEQYRSSVERLLSMSTVKTPKRLGSAPEVATSEQDMLSIWVKVWENAYLGGISD